MIQESGGTVIYRVHTNWNTAHQVYPPGEENTIISGEKYNVLMEGVQFEAFCYIDAHKTPGRPRTGFHVSDRGDVPFKDREFYVEANPYKDIKGSFPILAKAISKRVGDRRPCIVAYTG